MQPNKSSVTLLFNGQTQYQVPIFQRGYVWTIEKQVAPLWEDILDRAEALAQHEEQARQVGSRALRPLQKHFLGSIVLTPISMPFGRVTAFEVIDGQQRTTTLHLLMLAFRHAAMLLPDAAVHQTLNGLVRNAGPYSVVSDHHKVWPTHAGRGEMVTLDEANDCAAVIAAYPAKVGKQKIERPLLIQTYLYLYHACVAYLRGIDLRDTVSPQTERTHSDALTSSIRGANEVTPARADLPLQGSNAVRLYMVLQELVQVMTLTLEVEDDPQIIFETLNARGEPLLASDLIRNFIFLEASRKGLPVGELYGKHWRAFDEQSDALGKTTANKYWREKERQGRLTYPRIDLFFFHFTVLRRGQETLATHVFQSFKEWWQQDEARNLDSELSRIVQSSLHFRELAFPEGDDELAEFARLIKSLDVSTVTPLYLALRERLPRSSLELRTALQDIASFVVRRAVCGLTTKGYNRLFLKLVDDAVISPAPAAVVRAHLLNLEGPSQCWPSDKEFRDSWMRREVYKEMRPAKVCAVLRALEFASRGRKQETRVVPLQSTLTVEHVLPQAWQKSGSYPLAIDGDNHRQARDHALQTFGNLTLLTQSLNSSVSNGPFADSFDGETLTEGKRTSLGKSVLCINRYFHRTVLQQWDESAIDVRSQSLFEAALLVWGRPQMVPSDPDLVLDRLAGSKAH